MSCSCTLRELEPLHKEFICLICVIYCVVQYQLKYIAICLMLFEKQPIIMCLYSYNHFGTNPMQLIKVKCCGAVSNEMLRSRPKWNVLENNEELTIHQSWICLQWKGGNYSGLGTPFFSVRYITFFSILKKECSVLFHSFLEFLATYETQKNPKNTTFFCKERKRTQRTECSFAKNIKERKNVSFFCKRTPECI